MTRKLKYIIVPNFKNNRVTAKKKYKSVKNKKHRTKKYEKVDNNETDIIIKSVTPENHRLEGKKIEMKIYCLH